MNKNKPYSLFIRPPRKLIESKLASMEDLTVKEIAFKSPFPDFYVFDLVHKEIHKYISKTGENPTILCIDDSHYECLMAEIAEKEGTPQLLDKINIHGIELTICLCTLDLGVVGPASRDFVVAKQNELYKENK